MNSADAAFKDLIERVLLTGTRTSNRTGIDTIGVFGHQMRFDLTEGFPALTTKKLAWKSVIAELLWFLEGSDDERRLAELTYGRDRSELVGKHTIWTANADAQGRDLGYYNGDDAKFLGPIYGVQWRSWPKTGRFATVTGRSVETGTVDQLSDVIQKLRNSPDDRRIILTAWNPEYIPEKEDFQSDDAKYGRRVTGKMSLPPCHCFAQFRVYNGVLNCLMYQRSCDIGLGVPFNIASYAALTHILARETGLKVGEFVHSLGDAHIYVNHIKALQQQISQEPFPLPKLVIDDAFSLTDTLRGETPLNGASMFKLDGYQSHATIKMDMAV